MRYRRIILAGLSLFLMMPFLLAQSDGPARRVRNYNPATETTIKGTVEDVMQTDGRHGWAGVHLKLKGDQGSYAVHVGPSFYVSSQQFTFAKGDSIEVIGSKVSLNGQDTLIAREIRKDGKSLVLRDQQGFPQWSRRAAQAK